MVGQSLHPVAMLQDIYRYFDTSGNVFLAGAWHHSIQQIVQLAATEESG
jgi:hypothetical protein